MAGLANNLSAFALKNQSGTVIDRKEEKTDTESSDRSHAVKDRKRDRAKIMERAIYREKNINRLRNVFYFHFIGGQDILSYHLIQVH